MNFVKIVRAAGVEVAMTRRPGAPLLLLLRMASRGAGVWDAVWPALAERFEVAQFDLKMPAAEELDHPAQVFRRFAGQCSDIAQALGHERFHVFGWNGGTHVALQCAVAAPAQIRSCTLLGPFTRLNDMRSIELGLDILRTLLERRDPKLYAAYWFASGLSTEFLANHYDRVEEWVQQRVAADQFLTVDAERAMRWMRALRDSWVSHDELSRVRAPVLAVSHEDRWHAGPTIAMARALAQQLPTSQHQHLAGYGSLLLLEAPERFMAIAEPFFASLASS